jgi:hypothetical protein
MMVVMHQALRTGVDLAEALRTARMSAPPEPIAQATAGSFVCLGAG